MSQHVNLHDAEKLLGGYATGTLTEAERRDLMAAALEHQALFDALADEEALRELLADPAARAELLAVLSEGAAPKVVPFWRRHPGALGLAASLLIVATAGIAYYRTPEASQPPALPSPRSAPKADQVMPERPSPLPETQVDRPSERRRGLEKQAPKPAPEEVPRTLPAQLQAPAPPAAAPASSPAPEPAKVLQEAAADPERASRAKDEVVEAKAKAMKKEVRQPSASGAIVGVSGGSAAGTAAPQTFSRETLNALPMGRTADAVANLAPGVVSGPTWAFAKTAAGDLRLQVAHRPGAHVYLIRRTARGPVLVAPLALASTPSHTKVFPLPLEPGPMDLYEVQLPVSEPLTLPAEGPSPGFRARIEAPRK